MSQESNGVTPFDGQKAGRLFSKPYY